MTLRDLLASATERLGGERIDAELLLAHALGRSRAWLYAWPEHDVDAESAHAYETLVAARLRGEPVAYLIGHREFWSLDLAVTPDVLIPRPETELLVELALDRIPKSAATRIADLGTGSGAIAIAIARERPLARVLATDASAAAIAVARDNAERLGIRNIEFARGSWCAALGARELDLIVSNPPYIEASDAHLREGDLRFEPQSALASGADGLDAIREIAACAPDHLAHGGGLLLEHGWNQGAAVRDLLKRSGFTDIETATDIEGRDRVTLGRILP